MELNGWRNMVRVVSAIHGITCIPNLLLGLILIPVLFIEKPELIVGIEELLSVLRLSALIHPIVYFILFVAMFICDIRVYLYTNPVKINKNRRSCFITVCVWLMFASLVLLGSLVSIDGGLDVIKALIQVPMILVMIPFLRELSKELEEEKNQLREKMHQEQEQVVVPVRRTRRGRDSSLSTDITDTNTETDKTGNETSDSEVKKKSRKRSSRFKEITAHQLIRKS